MTGGQDQQTYQRAVGAALTGLGVQFVLTVGSGLVGMWSGSPAVQAATWQLLGGLPIWIVLIVLYHQHRLERIESLEAEQLAQRDGGSAIFDETGDELNVARRRLAWLYKWALNLVSVFVLLYLLAMGVTLLVHTHSRLELFWASTGVGSPQRVWTMKSLVGSALGEQATAVGVGLFAAAAGFVAFIVARYVAGMTRVSQWQLLRGGASYLMGSAFVLTLILIGAAVDYFGSRTVLALLTIAVPAIMLLTGVEMLLLLLMGAYRPRRAGELPRPAFDSRILGWLTSPESLAKIVNETINYQFGFEVSRSWFYRLLGKAITPLVIFALAVLILMSSLVIVGPHERAAVTRFGELVAEQGPGLHVKWPWPIGRAHLYSVDRIEQVVVGSGVDHMASGHAILWTNEHGEGKEKFLLTAPPLEIGGGGLAGGEATAGSARSAGMELTAAEVFVHYRIADLGRYLTSAEDPVAMLEAIAERILARYLAKTDIDHFMGRDRKAIDRELQQQIQRDADAMALGLQVVFVGLVGVHPPQERDVAKTFHEQIRALQQKQAEIENAHKQATATLAQVAGSVDRALTLDAAIRDLEQLGRQLQQLEGAKPVDAAAVSQVSDQWTAKQQEVDRLLTAARGQAAETIYDALADRWQRELSERGKVLRFDAQIAGYRRAPQYYTAKLYLDALAEVLPQTRRFVLPGGETAPGTIRIDMKDAGSALGAMLEPEEK